MSRLSPHFVAREFACKHCGRHLVAQELVDALERLRAIVGEPCVIVSGYRCHSHNLAVGGAKASQHLQGRAADLRYGYATVEQAKRAGFVGIGRRGAWAVHVDMRPGRPATWTY